MDRDTWADEYCTNTVRNDAGGWKEGAAVIWKELAGAGASEPDPGLEFLFAQAEDRQVLYYVWTI